MQTRSGPFTLGEPEWKKCEEFAAMVQTHLPLTDKNKIDDEDMLFRFLISNAWNFDRSAKLLQEYAEWRQEWDVDNIEKHPFHPELPVRGVYTGYQGVCKEGYPILWDRFLTKGITWYLSCLDTTELMKWHIYTTERGRELYRHLGTDRATIVIDCGDLDCKFFWSHLSATSFMRELVAVDQARFPEHMYKVLLINCSWGFNFLWRWLKMFLKDSVVKDVHVFTAANSLQGLAQFMDASVIPRDFGGQGPDLKRIPVEQKEWEEFIESYEAVPNLEKAGNGANTAETGGHASENGVHSSENGVHASENGVHASENGVHSSENDVHASENGVHGPTKGHETAQHDLRVRENGVQA
jgi:hypothetical protein